MYNTKSKMKQDIELSTWLKEKLNLPRYCDPPKLNLIHEFDDWVVSNRNQYPSLIFCPGACSPDDFKTIVKDALLSLCGTNWLEKITIDAFIYIINNSSQKRKFFYFNNFLDRYTEKVKEDFCGVEQIAFIAYLGKNDDGKTHFVKPDKVGSHYALLTFDFRDKGAFHYCDSLGWEVPDDLTCHIKKLCNVVNNVCGKELVPSTISYAHQPQSSSGQHSHSCSTGCWKNYPTQKDGHTCGVISVVMAAVFVNAPNYWENKVKNSKKGTLSWLNLEVHSSYLRKVLISWIINYCTDMSNLGITNKDSDQESNKENANIEISPQSSDSMDDKASMSEENDIHNGGTNKETGAPTQKGPAHSLTASENKNSDSKEGSAQGKSKEMKLPETTIRRIDKEKGDFEGKSSNEICKDIVEKYNKKPGNKDANYTEASLLEDLRDQESMELLVYRQKKSKMHAIENLLASKETGSTFSYIFFIIAKGDNATDNSKPTENKDTIKTEGNMETSNTKKSNIYCFTYGDAHNVIRGFEDTKFPRDVSKYVVTKEIKRYDVRNLRGACYAEERSYRNPRTPDRLEVKGVVAKVQGRVGAPLLDEIKALKLDTGECARIEVSTYGVRFMKKLTLKKMCQLIKKLDDDNEGKDVVGCDIMDYVLEVEDQNTIDKLEEKMFDKLLEYVIKGLSEDATTNNDGQSDPHPYDVMYKDSELHMNGKDFQFHLPYQKEHTKTEKLGSFDDVVHRLQDYLKYALLDKLRLIFKDDGNRVQETTFFKCLHGKFIDNYIIEAGNIKSSDGKEIQEDVMQNLEIKLVARILTDMTTDDVNDELKFYSINEEKKLTRFRFTGGVEKVDTERNYSHALEKLKSYLAKNLQIKFKVNGNEKKDLMLNYFHGEVILDEKAQENRIMKQEDGDKKENDGTKIYHKFDGRWFEIEQQYNKRQQQSFQRLLSRKFKEGTRDNIHLPKIWPIGMGEGDYNKLYTDETGFYVGNQITSLGIELCDIMKVLDNEIHLYHVKEGFGQSTRDACSQIQDRASQIGDREEVLKKFQRKKIVFVYAFGNTIRKTQDGSWSEDKKLSEFKDNNVEKFSRSILARQELCDTNVVLENLGFEFAICQISRFKTNQQAVKVKNEETDNVGSESCMIA